MLTADERARIEQAIGEAEAGTSAEFACVITEEASDYSEIPLLWAASAVMLAPILPLTFFAFTLQVREAFMGWIIRPEVSPADPASAVAFYATMQCLAFVVLVIVLSAPSLRRMVTPRAMKRQFVRQRALEHFISKGLGTTSERNGLLVFVSLRDKCAAVIPGPGIEAKIPSQAWSGPVNALSAAIRKGQTAEGVVALLATCRAELMRVFPPRATKINEIPNAVTDLSTGMKAS